MQTARSFDRETLIKIGKGALIAATAAAALYLLDFLGTVQFSNPTLTALVAWGVPTLTNVIKEWLRGQ